MTESELRTLRHIAEYRRANGISPTLDDLCRLAGLSSKSTARVHVAALVRDGYLTASSGSRPGYFVSRGHRLSATGLAALADLDPSTGSTTCPECGQPTAGGAP